MSMRTSMLLLAGVAVVAILAAGTATAAPVAPETRTGAVPAVVDQTATSNNTTMWTNGTTLSTEFDEDERLAMSDADANGTLHVAYTQDGTIRYAEVSTRGRVLADTELVTPRSGVGEVTIAATPDGRAHVVFETGVENDEIRRIAVREDGAIDFEQTFVDGTDVTLQQTLETGPRGRVYALVKNQLEQGQRAELWVLNGRDRTTTTREFSTGRFYSGGLTVRDGTLYAAYVTRGGEYPYYDYPLWLRTWDVSGGTIEQESDEELSDRFTARQTSVAVTASGYAFVSYANDEAMRLSSYEIATGEQTDIYRNEERAAYPYSVVVDRHDAPYVFDPSGYRRYDPGTLERDVIGAAPGAATAALNRDGFPSVLRRTDSDELVYQGMVVRGLDSYTNLYQRFETINEALIDSSRDINIDVTVTPASGEAFVAGSDAQVAVQGERVDPSAVSLQFRGEQYAPGEDGQAAIPLEESGTHELVVEYQGVSETISLQVDGENESGGTETATGSGSGFGAVASVLVVLGVTLLAGARRHRD